MCASICCAPAAIGSAATSKRFNAIFMNWILRMISPLEREVKPEQQTAAGQADRAVGHG